jgi:hypothetical protein
MYMVQHPEVVEKIEQELIYTFEKYEKWKNLKLLLSIYIN